MASLLDIEQKLKNLFSQGVQTASHIPQNIGNYFNPTSNGGNNFWRTPLVQGATQVQNAIQTPLPQVHFADRIKNPVLRFGASIPQSIINTPEQSRQGIVDLGQGINQRNLTPQRAIGDAADIAMTPLLFYGGGAAGAVGKAGIFGGKATSAIIPAAKAGAALMTAQGLSNNKNAPDVGTQIKNTLPYTAIGAITGGALGVGGAVATRAMRGKIAEAVARATGAKGQQAEDLTNQYLESRLRVPSGNPKGGQFAKSESKPLIGVSGKPLLKETPIKITKGGETVGWMNRVDQDLQANIPQPGLSIKLSKPDQLHQLLRGGQATIRAENFSETPGIENDLRNALAGASNSQDEAKIVNQFTDNAIKNSSGNSLKATRAALNKEINGIVGVTGNYKGDFAMRQTLKNDPALTDKINALEDNISKIDGVLSNTQQPIINKDFQSVGDILQNKTGSTPPPQTLKIIPPKKIGLFKQGWDRARNVIASQGEAGKQLASDLQKSRDVAETFAGDWVSRMPTVRKLNKGEFNNLIDVAEGVAGPTNTRVAQAAQEWSQIRNEIYNTAKQSGFDIGRVENYFPHLYDKSLFTNKNKYAEAINHLVQSGQAKTTTEASKMLRYAQDTIRTRRQGNLEFERLVNLPNYERTKDALFKYIDSASNRIAQTQVFGQSDENALKLINQIAEDGGDASTVRNLFDISVGAKKYGEGAQKISLAARKFNTITKLGLGAITNTGQSVNTATVVGALRTLKNIPGALFSKDKQEFALKAGVILDMVIQDLKQGSGLYGKTASTIGAPGFNTVEKFNRTLAAAAGKEYAKNLAKMGDAKTLAKMGIELKGNILTPEQEIQAARNIVERTQFKVDPQDLPGWSSSPLGKLLTQFKSFSYNQSAFLGREVIAPALKGNMVPLARFLAIGVPAGVSIQTIKNIIRNRKDEENPAKRVSQGFQQVGGYGLAGDIITGLFPQNNRYLDPNRATTMALGTLGGPTLGTAAEGYGSLTNALQGKPQNLERFGLKQVPLIGGTLQNSLIPYKAADGTVNRRFNLSADASSETPVAPTPLPSAPSNTSSGGFFGLFGNNDSSELKYTDGSGSNHTIKLNPPSKGKGIDAFSNQNWNMNKALEVYGANLSQDQKDAAYIKLGVDPADIEYAYKANKSNDIKSQYAISQAKTLTHDQLLQRMYSGRVESAAGDMFASNGVLDNMVDAGLLSRQEASILKKVKLDKSGKQIAGSSTGKKPAKVTIKKSSSAKIKFSKLTRRKTSTIKISKGPIRAKHNNRASIKLGVPAQKISYKIVGASKVRGLDSSVKIV